MVLQPQARSPSHEPHDARRPDPVRIVGISGAIALNAAALLLMLAPLSRPDTAPPPPKYSQPDWFEPRPVPPPPPPEIVPVERAAVPPAPHTPVKRIARPEQPAVIPPVVDGGSIAFEPAPPAAASGDIAPPGADTGPVTGMRLAYASASAPPYPRSELLAGHQGTVVLRVLVGVDGHPLEVEIESGSGYRRLDEAARRHVLRNWSFQPAMRDGRAVQAIGLVPIEFSLERG